MDPDDAAHSLDLDYLLQAFALIAAVRAEDWEGAEALLDDLLPPMPAPGERVTLGHLCDLRLRTISVVMSLATIADAPEREPGWLEDARRRAIDST